MLATIYTDASYKDGLGAGAAWIRSDNGRLTIRKRFKSPDPTHAEGIMIFYAIRYTLETWDDISVVFVNTDSLVFCHYLWDFHKTEPTREDLVKGVDMIRDLCEQHGVELRIKHVKGHQSPNKSGRAWLNNWCDAEARQARLHGE